MLAVPIVVWALITGHTTAAFYLFVAAGISDAVDGMLARILDQRSDFGTVLDPIADKLLLVSTFVVLGLIDQLPVWLTILVVSRDLLIVAGVMLAFLFAQSVTIKPIWVSKLNTLSQIVLAALVLGLLAFELSAPILKLVMIYITGLLTALSTIAYIIQGMALFSADKPSEEPPVEESEQ